MGDEKTRILFVCHGNICRSAMAQCVMQHLVDEAGLSGRFTIDSAATTSEELGEPMYPPARKRLAKAGVPVVPHRARRIQAGEQAGWDYIVCMDEENLRHLRRILGPENMGRVRKLMSFVGDGGEGGTGGSGGTFNSATFNSGTHGDGAGGARDVADPWYTGDFDATYDDVLAGCTALLALVNRELGTTRACPG